MTTSQIYSKIVYPFNIAALVATVIFFVLGTGNLVGGSDIRQSSGWDDNHSVIKLIAPVEKKIELGCDLTIKSDLNPFTSDHKDWIVAAKQDDIKEESDLNLEVQGVVIIKSIAKAIVKDLDEKNSATFRLARGDKYKGYTVAYVSRHHIVLKGKEKHIRFALKNDKGRLYSGKGEIFVAPDIDLYLKGVQADEEDADFPEKNEIMTVEDSNPAQVEVNQSGQAENQFSSDSGISTQSGTTGKDNLKSGLNGDTSAGQSIDDSSSGSTREEEMAFINELKKIFQNEGK